MRLKGKCGVSQKLVLGMILSIFPLDELQKDDLMQLLESNWKVSVYIGAKCPVEGIEMP